MTAPLLSEKQIRDLVYSVCGDNSLNESATRKAIRQAVKLAGEEAAKTCDALTSGQGKQIVAELCGRAIRARLG